MHKRLIYLQFFLRHRLHSYAKQKLNWIYSLSECGGISFLHIINFFFVRLDERDGERERESMLTNCTAARIIPDEGDNADDKFVYEWETETEQQQQLSTSRTLRERSAIMLLTNKRTI